LYCASSVSFSISTGRSRPSAARESSSSTSYQASGGQAAAFKSRSIAPSTRSRARISLIQALTAASDGLRDMHGP
jgi:hypothetical protein